MRIILFFMTAGFLPVFVNGQKNNNPHKPEPVYEMNDLESQPVFPGGLAAFSDFIKGRLLLPPDSSDADPEVSFVIDKQGKVHNVRVKCAGKTYGSVAATIENGMPSWIPGKKNGKTVNVRYSISPHFNGRK